MLRFQSVFRGQMHTWSHLKEKSRAVLEIFHVSGWPFLPNLVQILLSSRSSVQPGVSARSYSFHLPSLRIFDTGQHFFGRSSPKTPAQLSEAFPKPGLSLCWSHRVHPQQVKVGEWSHWDNGDSDNPPPNTRAGNPMPRSYFQWRLASSRGSEKLRVNTQRSNVALNYMKLWNNLAVDTQPCQ